MTGRAFVLSRNPSVPHRRGRRKSRLGLGVRVAGGDSLTGRCIRGLRGATIATWQRWGRDGGGSAARSSGGRWWLGGRPPLVGSSSLHLVLQFAASFLRYTARSITPPADRNGTSSSPPPKRRSPSRSPPPKSASRSPRPRSPKRRSTSRSPPRRRGRSRSRDRSRSRSPDDRNPGNNLYVTGLSTRVTEEDLQKFFSKEGKVKNCHVVLDPRTKESRGFAFVTMDTLEDARRCIKYLHRTVLEGRLVTVEKAKRTRERTPTPGQYCGRRVVRCAMLCY
ncbi:unnamed protein product [Miscanthus lutarioriparius]|uniref:RRM domain-containing protein n=1 Tax=Miscanthus lutarioriparius TaxID=422564 RepID=A0A811PPK1_9POAL|nr:unnamed protein product [Miscanthus lutarioriparius]